MFSEATIMELPVTGTVLIPYNMENTVYFPTLDLYQCNPGVVFSAAEGTPVLAAADGEVVSVENDARTGLTVTMNLGMDTKPSTDSSQTFPSRQASRKQHGSEQLQHRRNIM